MKRSGILISFSLVLTGLVLAACGPAVPSTPAAGAAMWATETPPSPTPLPVVTLAPTVTPTSAGTLPTQTVVAPQIPVVTGAAPSIVIPAASPLAPAAPAAMPAFSAISALDLPTPAVESQEVESNETSLPAPATGNPMPPEIAAIPTSLPVTPAFVPPMAAPPTVPSTAPESPTASQTTPSDPLPPTPATQQTTVAPAPPTVPVRPPGGQVRLPGRAGGPIPRYLQISDVGVMAPMVPVGLEPSGNMASPTGPDVVGWYAGSPRPGQPGNLLLDGHRDWHEGPRRAVFWSLENLTIDRSQIVVWTDTTGYVYQVSANFNLHRDDPRSVEVLAPTNDSTITLITCEGTFEPAGREYDFRRVVKARLVGQVSR